MLDDDAEDATRLRFRAQLLWYQRDRFSSRLKLLAVVQLLACCWYPIGPRAVPGARFGALCGCGVLLGLAAAHTCDRLLLRLHVLLCTVVAGCAGLVLRAIARALPTDAARKPSSHRLLLIFGGLTLGLLLLQLLAARACVGLLCLATSWRSNEEGGALLPLAEELMTLDLDEAPALPVAQPDEAFPVRRTPLVKPRNH